MQNVPSRARHGYNAGKKIAGRKWIIVVDAFGLLLVAVVHAVGWQDHERACFVMVEQRALGRRLKVVFADSAYGRNSLPEWVCSS
jgi:hypothetical protein